MPANEKNNSFTISNVGNEVEGLFQEFVSLVQVQDVLSEPITKDVGEHERVPGACFVTKVHSVVEEIDLLGQTLDIKVVIMFQRIHYGLWWFC